MIQHPGDPTRCVVLLAGRLYSSQAPLLWFAREAAQAAGWSVLELDERPPEGEDPFAWMHDLAGHALEATDADLVVAIGKSLGSAAAPLVSGPAVWLTPLLTRPDIVAALAGTESPALVIGSPDDPSWGEGELPDNPLLDVLELPGLDHSLQVDGDPMASLDVLRTVTQRIGAFLASVSA